MGIATVNIDSTLPALSANLSLFSQALNTLTLTLLSAINQAHFTITIVIGGVSRADFDSLKTALAPFELPSSTLRIILTYSETG